MELLLHRVEYVHTFTIEITYSLVIGKVDCIDFGGYVTYINTALKHTFDQTSTQDSFISGPFTCTLSSFTTKEVWGNCEHIQ